MLRRAASLARRATARKTPGVIPGFAGLYAGARLGSGADALQSTLESKGIVAGTGLGEIVADLLIFAQSVTGYAPPPTPPEIVFLSHIELERRGCDRPCEIYGWYPFGSTIYLDNRLDPVSDLAARAILLHELVHYLQQSADAHPDKSNCIAWIGREREAYDVQARWLFRYNVDPGTVPSVPPPQQMTCQEE